MLLPLVLAASAILSSAQVAHYTFDDGTAADTSGNGQNGTLQNGATIDGTTSNKYLSLDGSNDRVDLGTWEVVGDKLSISAWVWLDQNQNDQRVISKSTDTSNQNWALFVRTQGDVGFRITPEGGSLNGLYTQGNFTMPTGEWVHLVATYDGSTRKIFANGVERTSGAFTGNIQTGTQRVVIGDNEPTGSRPWNGKIDDVRVYDRALTQNEIGELYLLIPEGAPEPPEPDTTPPTDPTLVDSSSTYNSTSFSWTASVDENAVTYIIFRDGQEIGSTNNISYTDANLQPLTTYNYSVTARDTQGNESNALIFSINTTDIPPLPPREEYLEVYNNVASIDNWTFLGESGNVDSSTIRITNSNEFGTVDEPNSHYGGAWFEEQIHFTDYWAVTFDLFITNDNVENLGYIYTGGGMAFVIQNNQAMGLSALGEIGSDKNGILGLRESFSIVFDSLRSYVYWVADGGFNVYNHGWGLENYEDGLHKFSETQDVYSVEIVQSQAPFNLKDGIYVSIKNKTQGGTPKVWNRWIGWQSSYSDGVNVETQNYDYLKDFIPSNKGYFGFVGSGANNLTCRQEVSNIKFLSKSIPEIPTIVEREGETVDIILAWEAREYPEGVETVLSYGQTSRRLGMHQTETNQPVTFNYEEEIVVSASLGQYIITLPNDSEWYFTLYNRATNGSGFSAYSNEKRIRLQRATEPPEPPKPKLQDVMVVDNGAASFLAFNVGSDDPTRPDFYLEQELDLEASYDLITWFLMQKITYTGSLIIINDPEISYKPRKFYRLKLN